MYISCMEYEKTLVKHFSLYVSKKQTDIIHSCICISLSFLQVREWYSTVDSNFDVEARSCCYETGGNVAGTNSKIVLLKLIVRKELRKKMFNNSTAYAADAAGAAIVPFHSNIPTCMYIHTCAPATSFRNNLQMRRETYMTRYKG